MAELLRLNKIANTEPLYFRAVLKGSQGREIIFGTEQDIRLALVKAGVPAIEIDRLFKLAETDSGSREH